MVSVYHVKNIFKEIIMGGGGGYGFSSTDVRKLDQMAKDKIAQKNTSTKNIFISFDSDDLVEIHLFRGQSKNEKNDLEFSDFSVKEPYNSENADYIKQKISEKINKCSTCLVYITKESIKSKWVQWEIERCKELGKSVVSFSKDGTKIPENMSKYIDKSVDWNHKNIMEAIKEVNND